MSFFRDPKRLFVTILVGVIGLITLIDFAGPLPLVAPIARLLVDWAAGLAAIALLIGVVSVLSSHVQRVRGQREDWPYSLILIVAMLSVIGVGVLLPVGGRFPSSLAEQPVRLFFRTFYEPLAISLLALLAFFSLSAALRAFELRRREAIAIVLVAAVTLVVQLPPVAALPYVGVTFAWINDSIVLAGARGLLIGGAIGAMIAAIRVLLGFDQPFLDR